MKMWCILAAIAIALVCGCKRPEKQAMLFGWVPPKGLEPDSVTFQGFFVSPDDRVHPWREICVMHKVTRRFSSEEFVCSADIPSGSTVTWSVRYSSPDKGSCWTGDRSSDIPCGGRGKDVGKVRIVASDREVAFESISNGVGGPSYPYFNYSASLP